MIDKNLITMSNGMLSVPNNPVIPYIEGDGIGPDIWRASVNVFDNAVHKAFGGEKKNSMARGTGGRKII